MLEAIGWLGSSMLAICAMPQLIYTVRTGDASGLSWGFLALWGFGEIFTLIYIIPKINYPLICNYSLNCVIISVLVHYKLKGVRK